MMMKSALPVFLILLAGCVSAPVPETPARTRKIGRAHV